MRAVRANHRLLVAHGPVVGEIQAELLGGAPASGDGIVAQEGDRFVGVKAAIRGEELSGDSLGLVGVLGRVSRLVGTEPAASGHLVRGAWVYARADRWERGLSELHNSKPSHTLARTRRRRWQ
jgi:hypothetical protein